MFLPLLLLFHLGKNFIGGGWSIANREGGYNHVLMRDAAEIDTIGAFAGYFGGWDGLILVGDSDEEFFQNQLLYVPLIEEPKLAAAGELREQVGRACAEGKTDAEITARLTPPEGMTSWWRLVQWKHADSVTKVIRAVRSGALET